MTRRHSSRRCLICGIIGAATTILIMMIAGRCFTRVLGETPEF